MPKDIYKLDQFHGGRNSNGDPRDIAENELVEATNVMVDELGTIRTMGVVLSHASETGAGSTAHANKITPGYGLYAWNSDRTAANVLSTDYSGTHDHAGDHATILTDSAASFPVDALIGAKLNNLTDGSSGTITDNTATTITVDDLTGGNDNFFDASEDDVYSITDIPTTGANYLAFSDSDNTGTVMIYDMESDSWDSPITGMTNQSGGVRKDIFYAADGNLRICDGNFENTNTSQWYGYIDRVFFQSISDTEIVDQWYQTAQAISSPDDTSEFDNIQPSVVTYTGGGGNFSHSADSATYDDITEAALDAGTNTVLNMAGGIEVTVTLTTSAYGSEIPDVDDFLTDFTITTGSANLGTNTFLGVLGTSHKTDDKSEWGESAAGGTKAFTYTFSFGDTYIGGGSIGVDFVHDVTGFGVQTTLTGITLGSKIASCVLTTINVIEAVVDSPNTQAKLTTGNVFMQILQKTPSDTTNMIPRGWGKEWEYGISSIYDEKQESLIRTLFDSGNSNKTELDNTDGEAKCPEIKLYVDAKDTTFNRRLTGAVWYIREASGGETANQWTAQVEFDFVKGVSRVLSSGKETDCIFNQWAVRGSGTNVGGHYEFFVDNDHLLSPNLVDTYTSRTGILRDEIGIKAKYKTAVMVGRRMYVGNVNTTDEGGVQEVKGDAMLKSPVNRFDTFPSKSIVEAAVNDGESIVALEEFADRILQFKQNTLYIINVSQDIEFLEDVYKYKGVSQPSAVCKTDYGIAWANRFGCYLYDGKQVIDLLERGGRQIVNELGTNSWDAFMTGGDFDGTTTNPMIGYIPKKRQLIVVDDNTTLGGGHILLYDMVTQSWVLGYGKLTSADLTNFVNDVNGDLVWSHTSDTGTMRRWSDTSAASAIIVMQTKDIDLGMPGVRKKLYKVLITYDTGNVTSNVAVDYDVNGGTTFPYDFTVPVLPTANGWQVAELKPDTSSEANNIKSFSLRFLASGTGAEVTKVECVADSSDSLNGKYFDIYGAGGKTEVWIDTDNSGTSAPSGTGSYAQTIEVTEIETDDTANSVAIAVAAAVDDHANFSCEVQENVVYITDGASAARTDASDGDTGFTISVERQGGTASVPAGFRINDISFVYRMKPVK